MQKYNLTDRQRGILQRLVALDNEGYGADFDWSPPGWKNGSPSPSVIQSAVAEIMATEMDLLVLEQEGFVALRRLLDRAITGSLRQKAFDAVAADFVIPEPPSASATVNIGNYIENMAGGNVQGAAGTDFSQQQTVNDPEALLALFRETTDQFTETLTQLLSPQQLRAVLAEVTAVQEAVETGNQDASAFVRRLHSVGNAVLSALDVGDKVGGSLQALVYLGPWAHMAFQLLQSSFR